MMALLLATCSLAAEPRPAEDYAVPKGVSWVQASPDGTSVGWLRPTEQGRALHVAPVDDLASSEVVFEAGDAGFTWQWSPRPGAVFVRRWAGNDGEDPGLLLVDVATGAVDRLLSVAGVSSIAWAEGEPDLVWVGVWDEDPRKPGRAPEVRASETPGVAEEVIVTKQGRTKSWSKALRVDLRTREVTELWRGPARGWLMFDGSGAPRAVIRWTGYTAYAGTPDATWVETTITVHRIDPDGRERKVERSWRPDPADGLLDAPVGNLVIGDEVLLLSSEGVPRRSVVGLNLHTGERRVIWTPDEGDAVGAATSPTGEIRWGAVHAERHEWVVGPAEILELLDARFPDASWYGPGCSRDGQTCTTYTRSGEDPGTFWLWRRSEARFEPIPDPALDAFRAKGWRPMEATTMASRDGLPLRVFLTRPDPERFGAGPHPLVLVVHGGPYAQDLYEFREDHQWLADHGYAVVSVNFRGSTGFGRAFVDASDGEWGGRMQDDLLDAVDHAVALGVADPDRVAITGGSYGGYATLQALVTTDRFACGIAGAALGTLLKGGSDLDGVGLGSRDYRRDRSPVTHVGRLKMPLLVWHGDEDRIVPRRLVQGFVDAAVENGAPVTFVTYPEAGHGLTGKDAVAQQALEAVFLADCLGGVPEPLREVVPASSIQIKAGGAWIEAAIAPTSMP